MTMGSDDTPQQDPSSSPPSLTPTTWKESVSDLLSSCLNNNNNNNTASSSSANNAKIEKTCADILSRHFESSSNDDDDDGDNDHTLPETVRSIITTVYLRSLIKGGKYGVVVDYCRKHTNDNDDDNNNNNEELAYSLYRLRNYEACRQLCAATTNDGKNNSSSSRGLLHIWAQALYRMGETNEADSKYRQLLSTTTTNNEATGDTNMEDHVVDDDEREDALSNALANRTANYTPGSLLSINSSSSSSTAKHNECWLEEDDALQHLLASYGTANNNFNVDESKEEEDLLQNYDLAYNLATYLLVSNDARDRSHIHKARRLLEHAETSALTILESSSSPSSSSSPENENDQEEDVAARVAKEVARRKAQLLAEREAGPIRANLALAKLLTGGEENEMEALRGYLALITKGGGGGGAKGKGGGGGGGRGAGQANLIAAASNNLALLRDGKESVFDVMKRIPTTSSLSVSEDNTAAAGSAKATNGGKGGGQHGGGGGKGGKERGSTSSSSSSSAASSAVPLVGATPQQVRVALFNRALLFAKMGNGSMCSEVLEVLRASLHVSYHGDDDKRKAAGGGGTASGTSSSPKRSSKGKKKKGTGNANASNTFSWGGNNGAASDGGVVEGDVPTAKPASDAEAIAWNARADWLESELRRMSSSDSSSSSSKEKPSSAEDILNGAIAKLDEAFRQKGNASKEKEEALGALSLAKSQLLLHKTAVVNSSQRSKALYIEALESLPPSVQSCPGTKVTLASLYASSSNSNNNGKETAEKLLSSLGDDIPAKLAMAEFHMERGRHEDAIELLQGIVEDDAEESPSTSMEATALLVKALSYIDPSKAEEYVGLLQEAMGSGEDNLDGEALESMDIPRFAKKAMGSTGGDQGGAGGSSSKVRKMIAATGGNKRGSNTGDQKKKNRESTLRKRAKQREAHLANLQSQGRYDPTKTPLPKPDPERWIPKSQRSYNRRGRGRGGGGGGGRNKSNVGAQGGGAGAGMERDAAKLDVAARVALAKAGGGDGGGGKPSTANIKVSSSGAGRKGKGGRRR